MPKCFLLTLKDAQGTTTAALTNDTTGYFSLLRSQTLSINMVISGCVSQAANPRRNSILEIDRYIGHADIEFYRYIGQLHRPQ